MTDPIYKPRCFEEFKRVLENTNRKAIMTLRWNDLTKPGKAILAHSIKIGTKSIKNHPKATLTNIVKVFDEINPILDQTQKRRNEDGRNPNWAFASAYIGSRSWLEVLSTVIVISLQLRKVSKNHYNNILKAHAGWREYYLCQTFEERIREELNQDQISPEEQNEISTEEVQRATQLTINRNSR